MTRFSKTHEWIRTEEDGPCTVGITDHAQSELGDVVFVDLPEPGTRLAAGEVAGEIESVKAVSEIYSPVSGEVAAVNQDLEGSEELVNLEPYGAGWLFRLEIDDEADLEALMDESDYAAYVEGSGGEH